MSMGWSMFDTAGLEALWQPPPATIVIIIIDVGGLIELLIDLLSALDVGHGRKKSKAELPGRRQTPRADQSRPGRMLRMMMMIQ